MSLWKHVLDTEWSQRSDIEALKARAESLRKKLTKRSMKTSQRIDALETQVGELALLCRSLLTVLRTSGALDPDAFEKAMVRIDLEDGVLDNMVTPRSRRPGAKKAPARKKAPGRK